MKQMILNVLVLLSVGASNAFADKDVRTITNYMKAVANLKEVREDTIEEGVQLLEQAAKEAKPSLARIKEILVLSIYLLKRDPSHYAADLIYPLSQKEKKNFKDVLSTFPQDDIGLVEDALQAKEDEIKYGNG